MFDCMTPIEASVEDTRNLVEIELDAELHNVQINEYTDTFNEAGGLLTLRHVFNRLVTGKFSTHTLENTRNTLTRTINGTNNTADIAFLRRDLGIGVMTLTKRLSNTKDPLEKKEIARYIQWLKSDYPKMLTNRAKEIKLKDKNG